MWHEQAEDGAPSVSSGHWQDFSAPVTLTADQAGAIYRAITCVATTLGLAANHLTLLSGDRKDLTVLSANEMEALLAGALQLAEMAQAELEELHN